MNYSRTIGFALRFIVTFGISYWVWTQLQTSNGAPLEKIKLAPKWAMTLPAAVIMFNTVVHALRLQILFAAADRPISFFKLFDAILKGHFVGLVLPMGGSDLVKMSYLSRVTSASLATGILGLARLLEMIPWGGALIFGGCMLLTFNLGLGILALGCGGLLLLMCGIGIWMSQRNLSAWVNRYPRFFRFVSQLESALHLIGGQRSPIAQVTLLGLCFLVMNTFCLWGLCHAFQNPLSVLDVLTMFPLIDFLVSLPISLNGVGVRETVYPLLLETFDFKLELALAVAWTRWTGELFRAAVGGVLFWLDRAKD